MSSASQIQTLFEDLWRPYAAITPQAQRIHSLLRARKEPVRNDHVAFRTFNRGPLNLQALAQPFLELGYVPSGDYHFEQKKLDARSYSHPSGEHPRVFISQLRVQDLPPTAQALIDALLAKVPQASADAAIRSDLDWPVPSHETYLELAKISEYAAWVCAFGLRVNHFTVSVNALRSFEDLPALNHFLVDQGFRLNGEPSQVIQGSPDQGLEQSSTVADRVDWKLADAQVQIPSCYYEFARRYVRPGEAQLYDGFVTQSADKIFESTDRRHHGS